MLSFLSVHRFSLSICRERMKQGCGISSNFFPLVWNFKSFVHCHFYNTCIKYLQNYEPGTEKMQEDGLPHEQFHVRDKREVNVYLLLLPH